MAATTVQDILNSLLPKLALRPAAATEIYENLNDIVETISHRLWSSRSDLLKVSANFTVDDVNTGFTLADNFLGFRGLPYELSTTGSSQLSPLPEEDEWKYQVPGTPQFYQLIGNAVTLYPPPSSQHTYVVRQYALPAKLTGPTSVIPFKGLFDSIIGDMALQMVDGALTAVHPTFRQMLYERVDKVLRLRTGRTIKWAFIR